VVLSQFGHMFAPRPELAVKEMLRVLKPGGRIAFSTWPPELFTGRMFALVGAYLPPPPPGAPAAAPPPLWGDPNVVRERLGDAVVELAFERELLLAPALSPAHFRRSIEATAGPVAKLIAALESQPERLAQFRRALEALVTSYYDGNAVRQHFLMSRAIKK
jgi:SAM-dependent methyltransferase